ncbi:DNA-binding transcriptional regulator, LysR family [Bartonella apis]|uniref:LysR family transcriptional regulator n=1 Tax=Bartonella apis TaxID=1686310 RepID=UPI000959A061|nr:LysR family transcriptional regulator [Bartonella apis]OLY44749.1 DNA-binding transcriptional regulator, LysR family [Bartonella apis]
MLRENIADLMAFMVVAEEKSFTKAARKLNISQSALSHSIKNLEERLHLQLLRRTTRSVAPTDIGERLLELYTPHLVEMESELKNLCETIDHPSGTIRITAPDYAAKAILWPKLYPLLAKYPDIHLEISIDYALTDIVAERFDAGVRLGEQVEKDMIALKIGPDLRMAAVASPQYLEKHPVPETPRDLLDHQCINLRLPTSGGFYVWEFEENGHECKIRVEGQLSFNTIDQALDAAEAGFGIAYTTEDAVVERVESGRLKRILENYCPPFPGYYLYYPTRRQHTAAFQLVIDCLRYKAL